MGQFLTILSKEKRSKPQLQFFKGISLSKMREYYSLYKNISDSFAIDDTQFQQIFGSNPTVFEILDTDKNLLIDGLEIFAGIALISNIIQFQQRIEFLFSLFDFNDIKSLSKTDLQFLFLISCTVIQKLFGLKTQLKQQWVNQFIRQQFSGQQNRINISQGLRWAKYCDKINKFFQLILKKPHINLQSILDSKIYLKKQLQIQQKKINYYSQLQQQQWLLNNSKIFQEKLENQQQLYHCDIRTKINWIYGFRNKDVKQFLECICQDGKYSLVYFIGKIVILFSLQTNRQRHYTQHNQQIISITSHQGIIATGEYGNQPQIKIWDSKTLTTLKSIKGIHRKGVHLLKFFKERQYLISCGCEERSPVIIYKLQTLQIVKSVYCQSPAVEIALLYKCTSTRSWEFVIANLYGLQLFNLNENNQIICSELATDSSNNSRISCCSFIEINQQYKYLSSYDQSQQKFIITGHQKGQIFVYKLDVMLKYYKLSQQKCQVIKIISCLNCLITVTNSSYIAFWDIDLQQKYRNKLIDITRISQIIQNYDIIDLIVIKQSYLIVTKGGDVFIMNLNQYRENQNKYQIQPTKYTIKSYHNIFPLKGIIRTHKLIFNQSNKTHLVYYGGSLGVIWAINRVTHEIIECWNIGEEIMALDVVNSLTLGTLIVAGTISGKVYFRLNLTEIREKIHCQDVITCLFLSNDMSLAAIGCKDCNIYILTNNGSVGLFVLVKKINLQKCPTSLSLLQKKLILVTTTENQVYIVNLKDSHFKIIESQHFNNPVIRTVYHIPQKNKLLPVIIGANCKAIIACRSNGIIDLWRNKQYLSYENKISIKGHSSACSQISLSDDQKLLYSSGFSDQMIIQWRLQFIIENSSVLNPLKIQYQKIQNQDDQIIDRQISFCIFPNNLLNQIYDQHLLIRGIDNQTLCKLFKGMMNQWKYQNNNLNNKQPPQTSLKLQHVYGMQTFSKRNTLLTLNYPKRFIYFISRVIVIYNPTTNSQEIYLGHRFKVTCIAAINNQTIASGQSAYKPTIKIWSALTLQTINVLETGHSWGILEIAVNQNIILSYGLINPSPLNFSLELFNYKTGEKIAKRYQKQSIYSMSMNPLNCYQFVTASHNNVTFWQIKMNNFFKETICYTMDETITCCIHYLIGNNQSNILVGTKSGQIGIVVNKKKYISLKQNAHSNRINCIKSIRRDQINPIFITCSQDQTIKIWNRKMQMLDQQHISKIDFDFQSYTFNKKNTQKIKQRNYSAQSISIVQQNSKQLSIIIATRNGDVLQMLQQSSGLQLVGNFKYILYLKNHSCQNLSNDKKKVLITHHPKFQIFVSISQDQNLFFWDTQKNKLLMSKTLGYTTYPTAIKFSKDGQFLIVGYSDGLIIFLDSKITKSQQGKTDQKYILPTLMIIPSQCNKIGMAVLNIQISDSGDHLAVSFNNKINSSNQNDQNNQHSFISLFINRNKDKTKHLTKIDNDRIFFQKFTSISRQHTQNIYFTQKNQKYGLASYSMAFAQSQGKYYLLIYYQLVDSNQNRLNFTKDGRYVVWDVNTSTVIANLDLISSLNWKKFCFPNSIHCKYQLYSDVIANSESNQKQLINNNLLIPHMSAMLNVFNNLILGSVNGDLHLAKVSCLQYSNIFESYPPDNEMFIAKSFAGHCSQINQLQINPQRSIIYSTSITDECIFKWKIEGDNKKNTNDTIIIETDQTDIFGQVPTQQILTASLSYYQKKQNLCGRIYFPNNFIDKMKVKEIIGRKALAIRNNLKYDCSDRFIYTVGHTIIIYDPKINKKDFIYLEDDVMNIAQKINIFTVSKDCRFAYCCYSGVRCTLAIWQISSKALVQRIIINNICQVLLICLSQSNQNILIVGINKHRDTYLMLINIPKNKILGIVNCSYKTPWSIKAISFYPKSQQKFITCGIQSTKIWQLVGKQIIYKQMFIKKINDLNVINLCLTFLQNQLVTGCQDGSIIIWNNDPIKKLQHNDMILVLQTNHNILLSGSKDGYLLIWKYFSGQLNVINKILVDPLLEIQQKKNMSVVGYEIQALALKNQKILIGTKSGNIYEEIIMENSKNQQNYPKKYFTYHDNQTPKAFFFNSFYTQIYLYEITNQGSFTIWNIKNYLSICSYKFVRQVVDMIVSYKNYYAYIIFKSGIELFYLIQNNQLSKINQSRMITCLSIKYLTYAKMSPNEKMLAVVIQKNSDQSLEIQIFDIFTQPTAIKVLFRIPLVCQIQFIDFSINNRFFMIKDQNISIKDLTAPDQSISQEVGNKIEWSSDGLLYSFRINQLKSKFHQTHDNAQITKIIELTDEQYLVFDQFGGIYLYGNDKNLLTQCRMNITEITRVSISPDKKYIAVGSQFDRSIVVIEIDKGL